MSDRAETPVRIPPVDIWVGTSLGIIKGVSLSSKQCTNFLPGSLTLSQTDKSREICTMCWEYCSRDQLYVGLRSGVVQCFNCEGRMFTSECDCTGGEGVFVGLGKHRNVLITCTVRGNLCFWPHQEEKTEISVGSHVSRMVASPSELLQVATGGKENDLKLWDGNRPDCTLFQAKNVRHDSLDLRVPVWVTGIGFVPDSGSQPTIVVGTGYHQVRLYDTRAQRRPLYNKEFGDSSITALDMLEDGRSFVVGNAEGDIARFDLRKGSVVNRYKGFGGCVQAVQSHSSEDQVVIAACGLDRYLRVYNMHPPKLLHQMYLKLQCSCLLFGSEKQMTRPKAVEGDTSVSAHQSASFEESGSDVEDDLWASMETVEERAGKRAIRRKRPKTGQKPPKKKKRNSKSASS